MSFLGGNVAKRGKANSFLISYLTMLPNVHFRTGSSHTDMLECIEAATRKVIEMG